MRLSSKVFFFSVSLRDFGAWHTTGRTTLATSGLVMVNSHAKQATAFLYRQSPPGSPSVLGPIVVIHRGSRRCRTMSALHTIILHHVLIRRFWSDSKVLQLPVALERATHTTPCQFSRVFGIRNFFTAYCGMEVSACVVRSRGRPFSCFPCRPQPCEKRSDMACTATYRILPRSPPTVWPTAVHCVHVSP